MLYYTRDEGEKDGQAGSASVVWLLVVVAIIYTYVSLNLVLAKWNNSPKRDYYMKRCRWRRKRMRRNNSTSHIPQSESSPLYG